MQVEMIDNVKISYAAELSRAAFPDFALGHDPSKITPEQARILVLEFVQLLEVSA